MDNKNYEYDVFISHAVEDKMPLVHELSKRLEEKNLKVWYSSIELNVGDRITDTVFSGLDRCRFGVVVLSPTYLSKIWAVGEFFVLLTKEKPDHKVILPILYDITPAELGSRSALMANIYAIPVSKGLDFVVDRLVAEIKKSVTKNTTKIPKRLIRYSVVALIFMLFFAVALQAMRYYLNKPGDALIDLAIQKRMTDIQQKADLSLEEFIQNGAKPVTADEAKKEYAEFKNLKSYYRNEYTLVTGNDIIHSKKNVEDALVWNADDASPLNSYTFSSPNIYGFYTSSPKGYREENFIFYNTSKPDYQLKKGENIGTGYTIEVMYHNPVRLISTVLIYPTSSNNNTRRQQTTLSALRPVETFLFAQEGEIWVLKGVE